MLKSEANNWNIGLICITVIICYTVIISRVLNISMYDESKGRDFYHGDGYSDINAHSTGMYMHDYGFLKSKALPAWSYTGNKDTSQVSFYTHYPALPDFLTGVYAKSFNTKNERVIRIIPVMLSVVFAVLIFHVLNIFYQDKTLASISGCILLLSNYFIFWADNLHKHQYEEMLKWLFVGLIYVYYEGKKQQTGMFIALIIVFIINANISFEPIVYMAIVTLGFAIVYDKTIFSKETILLGLSAVIGFSVHLMQNYFYLGSIPLVIDDMFNAVTLRTVGVSNGSIENELNRGLTWMDVVNIPNLIQMRIERVFLIPGPAFFVFTYLAFKKVKAENRNFYKILFVLLIASISWLFVMTQHATVHCFTIRHFGIFYALVIGIGLKAYYELYYSKIKFSKVLLALHYIFWGYIVVMAFSQQFYDYFRYGILY